MSEQLVFLMGEYQARFPTDRLYAKNHMWAARGEEKIYRFGFTAYAVRLLLDVYFLEWHLEEGSELAVRQEIGAIESKKAESSLYAPIAGRLMRFNLDLLADPSLINLDTYNGGWLLEIQGDGEALLSPEQYVDYVGSVWAVTQRTLKGQFSR